MLDAIGYYQSYRLFCIFIHSDRKLDDFVLKKSISQNCFFHFQGRRCFPLLAFKTRRMNSPWQYKIETVFKTRYQELCLIAYSYVGNLHDAEDIVQDTKKT